MLVKLIAPLFGIIALLVVARRRRMPDDFLGLEKPRLPIFLGWFTFWIVWVAASEVIGRAAGQEPPKPWHYSAVMTAMRVLAIGVLGPIAEELIFRGVVLWLLWRRFSLPAWLAIAISSVLWAVIHTQYDMLTIAFILADGMILGSARVHSQSV
ncbi:MAG: CPBP family intramembrane glutamic endopeptidase, partial [Thermoanaerobaculia bacterium]